MAEWLAANARTRGDRVSYDQEAAQDAAQAIARRAGVSKWRLVLGLRKAAWQLSELSVQLAAARRAGKEETRAQRLSKLLSGAGLGRLAYHDVLRVLIQLADPMDISAEFFVDLVEGGRPERRSRYVLHADGRADELLEGVTRAKARFGEPSKLTD